MPAQWDASMVTLRNGRTAAIRSVAGREDAEPIQRFIRGLSARSRYQRFLAGLPELPPGVLERILSAPLRRETALVAEAYSEPVPRIVGLAQFASAEHEDSGEVAVVVAEDWRRAGLATQLLRRVAAQALSLGFHRAYADILRDNAATIELARRFDAQLGASPHGAALTRATASLEPDGIVGILTRGAAGLAPAEPALDETSIPYHSIRPNNAFSRLPRSGFSIGLR